MIVVEGNDLVGKTTLVNALAYIFNSGTVHLGLPPSGMRHWDMLVKELALVNRNRVFDRACLGSVAYKFMADAHNAVPVTEKELERFQEYMVQTHSLVVWGTASEAAIRARFAARGDNYLTLPQILKARQNYEDLIHNNLDRRLQVIEYCSDDESAVEFIDRNYARLYAALFPATGYVTDYRAHRLLGYKRSAS